MWTRLYRDEARVEFTVDIDWRGYDGFITAMMPCPGAGTLHGDMPFCVETKDLEAEPYIGIERQRQGMFIAQSFVDWCDGNTGIAYVSHDGDRYHIWDSRTNTLEHILINSVRRPQNTWEQHVNERMEAVGHSRFTFSIVPHAGTWRDAELVRTAETLRTPALRAWPGGGPATVPACQSMLSVDAENVAVSAFLREKGGAVHLRMVETHGHAATCTVHLPFNVESAHIAGKNAEHRNTSEPIIHGSSVRLELAPWEIVTLRLTAGGRLARL
jgi:alpha-mannosidase